MNSIGNNSLINTLKKYLTAYKSIFYKRSFDNFQIIVISILYMQEVKSIKLLYDKFIRKYWNICLNRFYYFLSEKNFNITELAIATINILIKLIPNELKDNITIYLIVDDTLQSKFGKHFDCYSKLFDHTSKNGSNYLNGHCFVCLAMAIPVMYNKKIHYIKIPVQYKLYDKSKTKLKLAADMVASVAPALEEYQVIVTCDSWYTKKPFINEIEKFANINVLGALRSDTVMYEVSYEKHTGKRGRPRKRGHRINYKTLDYVKDGKYFIAHTQAKTNLTDKIVYITVTTTDIETFKSVRLYMSTINPDDINSFDNSTANDSDKLDKTIYNIYKVRWNIEVIFYQQKTFWSFSNYMVRSKAGIEKYVNLLGVAYTMCITLPFINEQFSKYQFQSPQEFKYHLSEGILKELFIDKLLKTLQSVKNIITIKDAINYFASQDEVS